MLSFCTDFLAEAYEEDSDSDGSGSLSRIGPKAKRGKLSLSHRKGKK